MPISRRRARHIVVSSVDSCIASSRRFLGDYCLDPRTAQRPLYAPGPSTHRFFYRTQNPQVYLCVAVDSDGTVHGPLLHTTTDACIVLCLTKETRSLKLQSLIRSVPFRGMSAPDKWYLQGQLRYPGEVSEHAEDLLTRLGAGESQLRELTRRGIVNGWFCIVVFYAKNLHYESESWHLNPAILARIAALGIKLNVQHASVEESG